MFTFNFNFHFSQGGNLSPATYFSSPQLFIKSCLLLVIASADIWVGRHCNDQYSYSADILKSRLIWIYQFNDWLSINVIDQCNLNDRAPLSYLAPTPVGVMICWKRTHQDIVLKWSPCHHHSSFTFMNLHWLRLRSILSYFWPPLKGSLPCRPRHPWSSNHLADRNPWLPHLKHLHRPGRGGQDLRSSRNKQEVDLSGRSQPCPDHRWRHHDQLWHRLQGGVQQRRHRVLGHRRLHHHRRQHRPHRLLHLRQLGPLRQPHLTDRVLLPQNPALCQGHLAIGWDHRCNLGENYLKFFSIFFLWRVLWLFSELTAVGVLSLDWRMKTIFAPNLLFFVPLFFSFCSE